MFFRFLFAIILSLSCTGAWAQFDTIRTGSVLVLDQASLFTTSKLGQDILVLEQSEQIYLVIRDHRHNKTTPYNKGLFCYVAYGYQDSGPPGFAPQECFI